VHRHRLQLRRRVPSPCKRPMRGLYPGVADPGGMGGSPAIEAPLRGAVREDGGAQFPPMPLQITASRNAQSGAEVASSAFGSGFGRGIVRRFEHPIMPAPSPPRHHFPFYLRDCSKRGKRCRRAHRHLAHQRVVWPHGRRAQVGRRVHQRRSGTRRCHLPLDGFHYRDAVQERCNCLGCRGWTSG